MFQTIKNTLPQDKDYPPRQYRISVLTKVLRGTLYDGLKYAFHEEKNGANEYIPLRDRRPSVRYGLCKLVVDDSVGLLFSEGHFPEIVTGKDGENARATLARIIKETSLNEVMIDSATRGSVGSVVIHFRVLGNRVFFSVLDTPFLTPTWKANAPDTLENVIERYKVKGKDLVAAGYSIKDDEKDADFWFQRIWDSDAENWYTPIKVDSKYLPQIDKNKTVTHSLGFVPMVWVKNLPGGDEIDGACTFSDEVIDTAIEIDYQLSQVGRGLKYSQDPTLLIKEPAFSDGKMVRSASNAITLDKDGDAKMLEINGTASAAVIEYVRTLREMALETAHGNRSNADKVSAAQSGRAMELMHAPLIRLADQLRIAYGEGAMLELLNMVIKASEKLNLIFKDGSKVGKIQLSSPLALRWSAWFPPTAEDLQATATTLGLLVDKGIISRETAVKVIAVQYDIEDTEAELTLIKAEMAERDKAATKAVTIQE